MKKILGTGVALALMTGAAFAADIPVKAPIVKAAPTPIWDIAIGGTFIGRRWPSVPAVALSA